LGIIDKLVNPHWLLSQPICKHSAISQKPEQQKRGSVNYPVFLD
jgi:hypothetical protein